MDTFSIRMDGPYLRVVLPDDGPDWEAVRNAIELELDAGVELVEILAPSYRDEASLAEVRALVALLERNGVDAIVEWQGVRQLGTAGARG
jgi:hypothetical protein